MTIPELITVCLNRIRAGFYAGRVREFKRDERALTKAVMLYGCECEKRGWEFQADILCSKILDLLHEVLQKKADIRYLPTYLEGAIKRSVGQKAEELSEAAKHAGPRVSTIVRGLNAVQAVVQPTAVETCAAVYRDLSRRQSQRRHQVAITPRAHQGELL